MTDTQLEWARHFWLFFVPLCSVLSFHGFHTCAKPPVVERKLWVADVGRGGHRLCLQYWPPKLATCVAFFLRVPTNDWLAFQQIIANALSLYRQINVPKDTICVCSIGLPSSQPASLFFARSNKLLQRLRLYQQIYGNQQAPAAALLAKWSWLYPQKRPKDTVCVCSSQPESFFCAFLQIIG